MACQRRVALITQSSAIFTEENTKTTYKKNIIKVNLEQKPINQLLKNINNDDILITPYDGDDQLPSLTKDNNGHTIVTWTNKQNLTETYWGIAYSEKPYNQESWINEDNNYIYINIYI